MCKGQTIILTVSYAIVATVSRHLQTRFTSHLSYFSSSSQLAVRDMHISAPFNPTQSRLAHQTN